VNVQFEFDVATKTVLSRDQVSAYIVWALVSQAGRSPMSVGEVAKFVRHCSGVSVSAYQVKKNLLEMTDGRVSQMSWGGQRGLHIEKKWEAGSMAVCALAGYSYVLSENEEIYNAVIAVCGDVGAAAMAAIQKIKSFNRMQEQSVAVSND